MKSQTVLFYLALIAVLVTVSVSGQEGQGEGEWKGKGGEKLGKGKPDKPVTWTGTYKLDTDLANKKFGKYLKALGVNPEKIKRLQSIKKVLIAIRPPNATHFNIEKILSKTYSIKYIFESGKEFEAGLSDGTKLKSTIIVDKAKMELHRSILMNGVKGKQEVKFSPRGFVIHMKAKKAKSVLRFSKLKDGPIGDEPYDSWLEGFKEKFFKD